MISTGLPAENTPENIAQREPTSQEMQFITPDEAKRRWGGNITHGERNRISTVEGNTLLVNEPKQFLDHYYHFVAELLFGARAFLYGAFNPSSTAFVSSPFHADQSLPSFNMRPSKYEPPSFTRLMLLHASSEEWRDKPGFNAYFLRAIFPSLALESAEDWADLVASTVPTPDGTSTKAWHFPVALLADRSAAHRGEACGSRTQRIAAEPWELMLRLGAIDSAGHWWSHVRESITRFATGKVPLKESITDDTSGRPPQLPLPETVVITYINRQGVRRHLDEANHEALVAALQGMVNRKRDEEGKVWELNIVQAETITKDEQISIASRSTILLGVHGNGLTHLVLMQSSRLSAVIEIFYPGGFARDYEWTARALGMRHFSVWNDTYFTHPNEPPLGYPEGFQGTSIPVHGPAVAKLIEDRLDGRL